MDHLGSPKSVGMVIVITYMISIVISDSSFPCTRTSNQTFVDCSNMGLAEFPPFDEKVISVDFSFNKLEKIEILKVPTLCFLNLSNNAIYHIHLGAFEQLTSLQVLDLSFNSIRGDNLTRVTFGSLKALEMLYLQGNPLRIFPKEVLHFMDMDSLKFVDMSFCRIARIEDDALVDITTLETLYLNGNELTGSDLKNIKSLSYLTILDISENPLKRIAGHPFLDMIHLTRLDMESCQITSLEIDAFDGLYQLTYLSLNNNSLETISMETFLPLLRLDELILSRNPIKVIDANTFNVSNQNVLRILKLEFMPELESIRENSFKKLDSLQSLYISNNLKLTQLEKNAFLTSSLSLSVNLDNNSLSTLPKDFVNWKSIQWISFHGNPWYCDCKLSWIVSLAGPKNKTTPMICQGPAEHRGLNLLTIPPNDLGCINKATKIVLGVLLLIGSIVLLTFSVFFIVRWLKKGRYTLKDLCCYVCTRRKGERYISVYQNDDVEPFASITFSEEDDKSKTAVDV